MKAGVILAAAATLFAGHGNAKSDWKQADMVQGNGFYDKFTFFTDTDPTHGSVAYQSQSAAQQQNLTSVEGNNFEMRVSTEMQVQGQRPSVRLQSKDIYADGVYL